MFQIPRKQIWTSQPQGLVEIDRSSQLSSGLVGAWDQSGKAIVKGGIGDLTVVGATRHVSSKGVGFSLSGSGQYLTAIGQTAVTNLPFTLFTFVQIDSAGASARVFDLSTGTTAEDVIGIQAISNSLVVQHYDGGINALASVDISSNLGKLISVAAVFESLSSRKLYINGSLVAADTSSVSAPSGVNRVTLGYAPWGGSEFFNGKYVSPLVFNKTKTASEIKALHDLTWQIFKRPDSRIFVPVSAGGGPASVTGDISVTLESITSNLQVILNHTGTISTSLQDIVVTSSGNLSHSTILNISLDTIGVNIAGSVTAANVVNGTLGITLDDIVANFGGAITHTGTTSFSLDDVFVTFSGTVAGTPENITGDFALTLDGVSFNSSGNAGTITLTEDDINAIMNAIINNPKTLTIPKFLGLK